MTLDEKAIANVDLFAGDSEMAMLMRSHDWSQTPLGSVENWPQSLRTIVSVLLNSRYPMFIFWGPKLIKLYNDSYRPILGSTKHPEALGKPGSEVWPEIWDTIGPMVEQVITKGSATWSDNLLLFMQRSGYLEEVYFTFSYSPIRDESGVGGMFCACTETTQQVLSDRRLRTLRSLSSETAQAKTVEEACQIAVETLFTNPYDIPFALLYLVEADGKQARLVGTAGIERGTPASPVLVDLTQAEDRWSLTQVCRTEQATIVKDLASRSVAVPEGVWNAVPSSAVVMPLAKPASKAFAQAGQPQQLAGLLVMGVSPRREFDDEYQGFFDLVASNVATAIANASAYEAERLRAEALAQLDRAKTTFFSNVSHEFRTPLTLMLDPLNETLSRLDGQLSAIDREQLQMVQRNGQRLLKLVNTLLDFSRIEVGRVEATYEPTDLAAFTSELANVFRSAIAQANLSLIVDCPPLAEPAWVDREMWEKIVLNLLSNAFKFTFEGEIAIVLRQQERQIELEVRDTGIGIPASELPHIFERFHQVRGAKGRTYEGSGIGLSLVQELVHLHGGTIQASSAIERGTSFTVSIPAGCAHLPPDQIGVARTPISTGTGAAPYVEEAWRWLPEEAREQGSRGAGEQESLISPLPLCPTDTLLKSGNPPTQVSSSAPPLRTARILLVDDNTDMRDYVKRLLLERGYDVETAVGGVAALVAVGQQVPDLVLTDIMMPQLDGLELLRELRADLTTREIPIVLLSARAGEESRVEGLEAGADDYLIKPFSARELLARVEANLKLARLRQEATQREQALRQEAETAKRTVETILSSISDGFVVLDRHWCFTYINDRYCEMTGMQREEMLGQNVWDVFPDIVGDELYVCLHQAMAEQTIIHYEYFYPRWNRWFENHIYPSANGLTVFVTEVSERKIAAAALRESEARFRSFAENSNDVIWITDAREYRLIYVSPSYEQVWGRSTTEIYADLTRFIEFVHPDDRQLIQTAWQQCTQGGFSQEYRVIRPDGAIVWIRDRGFPVYGERGELLYLGGIAEDITARKQAELMLVEQKRLLEAIASGQPLDDCLCAVCAAISKLNSRIRACILLADAQRLTFPRSIAPDFPPSFGQGLKDAPINELAIGTCGEAVYCGQPVTCADIANDDRWSQAWRDLCVAHGVLACHSTPVLGVDGLPLGSLMLCFDEARLPNDWEYQLSNFGTQVASIAFERDRASLALRESEERLRLASEGANLGMWYWNIETDTLIWTDRAKAMFGLPSDTQMSMQVFLEAVHPNDRPFVETIVSELQAGQTHTEIEYRTLWADGTIRWILARGDCDFNADGILIATQGVLLDISDRKTAEEKLRQREAELKEAQRLGRFGNWHWDAQTDVTTGSDELLRIYGFDPATDTMPNFADQDSWLYPHESWQRINAGVQQALSTGHGYELDVQAFRNGTPIWITTRSEVLRDSDGKIVGLRGTVQDITERKLAEAALRDSEERFRTLADNMSQFAWTADANGWIYWYNRRWFEYTGTTLEEMQGWGWQQVHHPEHVERVVEHIRHCFETGEQWEDTFPLRGKDGTYRWFLSRAIPIRDEQRRILRWFGTNTDITDRKQAEAELRQKNAILDVVNESAPTPIFVKDRQGRMIYANPATLEVLGKSADEVIGARDCDLYPNPEAAARVMENDRRIMESGQTQVVEESPDGIRTFLGMKAPYRNEAGEVIGLIGISNDITDRVQLERDRERILQQEQAAREAAEQANRIKDEFLAVLSHELRSPLNPILGWAKLLQNGTLDAAKTKQALSTIERNAKLQSQLIEDLLDVSRILQGKLSLNASPVNLTTIVRAAIETVRLAAEAKSIQIETIFAPNIGYVWGDATRLQQVVWNLVSNAVKFTSTGSRVEVRLEQVGDRAQIVVSDNGKGITSEFLPHVFDYFRQADSATTRKFGGLGLGLAIVRYLVELHGGTVRADSPGVGLGATFTVKLPLMPIQPEVDEEQSAESSLNLQGIHVLVVDDDRDTREFVAFLLEQAGARVDAAACAGEGFAALTQSKPDILVSDIGMPDIDGYMLLQKVRALPPEQGGQIEAIALTAYAGEMNQKQALAAGFQMHISKPVEPEELIGAIVNLIKRN